MRAPMACFKILMAALGEEPQTPMKQHTSREENINMMLK